MDKRIYHHGDLKKELIQKGIGLLAREGYEGFSLRKLAALCNVSHAAPYRHFGSKEELISAINQEIAADFRSAFSEGASQCGHDKRKRLIGICMQYVRFMKENPDYFRYVFMTVHERPIVFSSADVHFEDQTHPFFIGKELAKDYFLQLNENDGDWAGKFLTLWSQVQGLTLLLVNRTIEYRGDYLAFAQRMIERCLNSVEKE